MPTKKKPKKEVKGAPRGALNHDRWCPLGNCLGKIPKGRVACDTCGFRPHLVTK